MRSSRSGEHTSSSRVTPGRAVPSAGDSSQICGLPPSVAEFLLQQALTAFGGVHGLVKQIDRAQS